MPNARIALFAATAALALAGCSRQQANKAQDQNLAIDEGLPSGQLPSNADIETLPADESSVTPSSQLQNGADGADINDTTANAE